MYDYVVGTILFSLFTLSLYILGTAVLTDEKNSAYRFIIGYLVYSFFVAVGGIIIQIMKLPWLAFFIFMVILIIFLGVFSAYRIKKYKIKIFPDGLKAFISEHWFLFIICLMLLLIMLLCFIPMWFNNHLDDGYYINKMAVLPYTNEPFNIIPSTGFLRESKFDPYTLNTHELEASFYIFISKITPTVYARFFLAGFNYFLLANCVYALAKKILDSLNITYNKKIIQFIPAIVILFAFNEIFLKKYNLMFLQDSNQFTNAMYYGSSIVRTMGILFLIIPFIDKPEITWKTVVAVVGISIVLISKSTIAIPLIFSVSLAYLFVSFLIEGGKKRWIALGGLVIFVIASYVIGNTSGVYEVREYATRCFTNNASDLVFIPTAIIFGSSFFLKSRLIKKYNLILLGILILLSAPLFSNITSLCAVYAFVMGRANTAIFYTFVITAYIYIYIMFVKVKLRSMLIYIYSLTSVITLTLGAAYSISIAGGSVFYDENGEVSACSLSNALSVIWHNKKIAPESTFLLGASLNRLAELVDEEVNVVMRELDIVDNTTHALATSITAFAPTVHSVSAVFRYGPAPQNSGFEEYSGEDQVNYEKFVFELGEDSFKNFSSTLSKYPINCVVLPSFGYDEYMKKLDFYLYDNVVDEHSGKTFYIYYKGKI